MHPDDMPPTLDAIAGMSETGRPTRFENRIATRDGQWKHIEWTVAPEPDGLNFIAVGRDLTEAKARQAELDAARDALRQSQKLEAMGSLTGGVAHDFNNLLTPIVGSLDLLIRRGIGNEREQRLIEGALQSAERARILVQRLLAFARRQPLQPTAVDVGQLVAGMTELIASTLGPTIEVRTDLQVDLSHANADANQLEMALLNLAVNARDAMPDGGKLTISAQQIVIDDGHESGFAGGCYICLTVCDTGIGMDAETIKRAAEPFFSTKGIGKGTGLGLSMVHGLAAQLGGGLTIDSTPGEGTTMALWLPVSSGEAAVAATPFFYHPKDAFSGTALLVDDEDLVRMSAADMLTGLGYEVIGASSAEEALRLVHGGLKPNILVTDHLMQGMSGVQLAAQLGKILPAMPVLIISGFAEEDGIAASMPRLVKPFRNDELAQALSRLSHS
jgi:signal transduction histidine kinase/CheY-like chemotaxis protein